MKNRIFRFLASGGAAAALEYLAFTVLQVSLGRGWLLISQPISFLLGFITSFLLNRYWVFRSSGTMRIEVLKYGSIAMVNLVVGDLLIALLSGPLELDQYISKLVVMAMIAGWNYLLFSKLVFKPRSVEV